MFCAMLDSLAGRSLDVVDSASLTTGRLSRLIGLLERDLLRPGEERLLTGDFRGEDLRGDDFLGGDDRRLPGESLRLIGER